MSDYAGSILQVAGAIVSIWFPPVGAAMIAAGGALNAYQASQQVIPGPKIGDAARQTSQEGGFRVIVYGRSYPFMGNIIADGGPVIVTKRESTGKGGPKVETESAYRTYAVGICEGEANLLQAWRNGILVYDIEDPSMSAENAKFLEYARWFNGSFTQNASPDLEAVYGAGNAPFFRGTAYLVLAKEDVTDQRAAWSQWQVRVFRGASNTYTTPPYPVQTIDSLGVTGSAKNGLTVSPPVDELSIASFALDGVHKDLLVTYDYGPEDLGIASAALNGTHRALIVSYSYGPEEIQVSSSALNGTHRQVVIPYLNYLPEELGVSSHALNGTHGPA